VTPRSHPRVVLRRVGLTACAVVVLALLAFTIWANTPRAADPDALAAARAMPGVDVTLGSTIELRPVAAEPRRGVVFYPGARVSPEAYVATWAPIVAETDTLVLIPQMPFNLAVFGRSRADGLLAEHPGIDGWWIGGHSLGGAMASSWVGGEPEDRIAGLVLWASYPTGGAGLGAREHLEVLSVSGSNDGLATPDDIRQRRDDLPPATVFVEVDGMNHAQFGRYGAQRGDLEATIDDAQAQRQLTEAHRRIWNDPDPEHDDPSETTS
jgi:hypothetical protein